MEKTTWEKIEEFSEKYWMIINIAIIGMAIVIALSRIIYLTNLYYDSDWWGFNENLAILKANENYTRAKSFWDLLELIIVPLILAIGLFLLNHSIRGNAQKIAKENRVEDKKIAEDNRNQATLEAYFGEMTKLIFDRGLGELTNENALKEYLEKKEAHAKGDSTFTSDEDEKVRKLDLVRTIAITRTLSVLRSLDAKRVVDIFRFIDDANLINIISFNKKLLIEVNWEKAMLVGINLQGAALHDANLQETLLFQANLKKASLISVNLQKSDLEQTDLEQTDLCDANLKEASLKDANLSEANLEDANLSEANLKGVRNFTNDQLMKAKTLEGATMPDGTIYYEGWFDDHPNPTEPSAEEDPPAV